MTTTNELLAQLADAMQCLFRGTTFSAIATAARALDAPKAEPKASEHAARVEALNVVLEAAERHANAVVRACDEDDCAQCNERGAVIRAAIATLTKKAQP